MKKFIKMLAFIIDIAFTPVRLVVAVQTLICACIVHEWNFKNAFVETLKVTFNQIKLGFKPTLDIIFKKGEA